MIKFPNRTDPTQSYESAVVDSYINRVANKLMIEKYGKSTYGKFFTEAQIEEKRAFVRDIRCEVASQDGNSTNITSEEAKAFIEMHYTACVKQQNPGSKIPSMKNMNQYYNLAREDDNNSMTQYETQISEDLTTFNYLPTNQEIQDEISCIVL